MKRALFLLMVAGWPLAGMAADDSRVAQLEQDVRDLKRQVMSLSRDVENQRRALQLRPPSGGFSATPPKAVEASTDWIDAAKWQKVRIGMRELDVVTLLGPPTSMRAEDGARVLLYAMEIGSSGYLGGSVTLKDRVVTAIEKPALK